MFEGICQVVFGTFYCFFLYIPPSIVKNDKNLKDEILVVNYNKKYVIMGRVTAQRMVLRKFTREAKVSSMP